MSHLNNTILKEIEKYGLMPYNNTFFNSYTTQYEFNEYLRKEYGIFITITKGHGDTVWYSYNIQMINNFNFVEDTEDMCYRSNIKYLDKFTHSWSSYEEAFDNSFLHAIMIVASILSIRSTKKYRCLKTFINDDGICIDKGHTIIIDEIDEKNVYFNTKRLGTINDFKISKHIFIEYFQLNN